MNDREFDDCMARICAGEKEALRAIYDAYGAYVFHLLQNLVARREDAEDLTSEFFIKLWKTADKYRPGGGHRAYLATVARHMAIDFLRANRRELPTDFQETPQKDDGSFVSKIEEERILNADGSRTPTAEETILSEISLRAALDMLKPAEREVVHLKIAYELTFEEIAHLTDTPLGTVTWRYQNAIKKLRKNGYGTET